MKRLFLMVGVLALSTFLFSQKNPTIYEKGYPIATEDEIFFSYFVVDKLDFPMKIIGSEREEFCITSSDYDIISASRGELETRVGEEFIVVRNEGALYHPHTGKNLGFLMRKIGLAKVTCVEEETFLAELRKCIYPVMKGDYLIPFEPKLSISAVNKGYEICPTPLPPSGTIVYLENGFTEAGLYDKVVIDLGEEDGVNVGAQMTILQYINDKIPKVNIGNLIVIEAQKKTSIGKILSCRNSIRVGDLVELKH
ncbi:MAG: hypothetical protein ACUVUG_08760 [Candidatus Aminicenantia bacterium]